ncbi:MAG: cobalamin B12-binding domain-containing protein [Anaerolineae bacterium]
MSEQLVKAFVALDEGGVLKLVEQRSGAGEDPLAILEDCRQGMTEVGKLFEQGEYFISELIMAGEIFKQAMQLLLPKLAAEGPAARGKVVIGTVKGDIHDLGKNIVVTLLKAANYEVHDLGVDVPPERFVETVKETGAKVLGMSGLLTISFDSMKRTVQALTEAGLRDKVKVMVGGGMTSEDVCKYVGADAWGADAQAAVTLCNQWMEG